MTDETMGGETTSVVAELSLPSETFRLGSGLWTGADVRIQLDRVVPVADRVVPYFWAAGPELATYESDLRDSERLVELHVLERQEDRRLYEATWTDVVGAFVTSLIDNGAALLEGRCVEGVWEFTLRFPDEEALSAFHTDCRDADVTLDVESLREQRTENGPVELTARQRETLITAYEEGYFDIPRETSLEALGERFGISDHAVSERLRRGTGHLIEEILLTDL